ncbi:hypothetical protein HanPSC8_Chr06g0239241 [Helianthus annuus]|nr:hypothetical protein HanPSC8_Chr06g0239241 [Helianthus annuus]
MESSILNFLKFELTTPRVRCFLRRFVCVVHVVRYMIPEGHMISFKLNIEHEKNQLLEMSNVIVEDHETKTSRARSYAKYIY